MTADSWIERVRAADAEAEDWFIQVQAQYENDAPAVVVSAHALISIAAELRAQRIARRPGAGQ